MATHNDKPLVLIVDDEQHIVEVVRVCLERGGVRTASATCPHRGLELARALHPDLVVSDFEMPGMNGIELCRAIAELRGVPAIPVVMLTARGYDVPEEIFRAAGVASVLIKPFSPAALMETVRHAIADAALKEAA